MQVGSKYASALRQRDLRTLILAFITDGAATWSYNVVLIAYMFGRTHSAGWITALVVTRWVAGMVLGGYGGVLADRFDRRAVLMSSAAVATIVALVIALEVQIDAPLIAIVATGAVLTAVCTPIRPASGALIPEVVPESDLVAANSIFALLESVIVVLGPGIGAALLVTGRPVYGIVLNAASYVVSGLLYARLRVRSKGSAEPGGNAFRQWGAGLAELGRHRKALVLTVFLFLDSGAVNAANVLMPALAAHLHGSGSGYSLLIAANAFGAVLVASIANKLSESSRTAGIIATSLVLECVPLWLCYFAHVIPAGMALQLVSGAGMVIVDVLAFTALQRDLPRDVLGRVLGSVDALMLGSSIAATLLASAIYSVAGLGAALAVIGLGFAGLAILGLPLLRGLDAEMAEKMTRLRARTGVLERLDLFAGAPRSLIERLAEAATTQRLPKGLALMRQGEQADALWIVTEGSLAVSATLADGRAVTLPEVDAPGYVGELGLLHRAPRSATVTTATSCRLLKIPGPEFLAALEEATPSPTMLGRAGVRQSRTSASPAGIEIG